jgi:hypothetical protein
MAIDVVCECGKRLKAPDWMAGRSTQCPACWNSVSIPRPRLFGLLGPAKQKRGESPRPADANTPPPDAAPAANSSFRPSIGQPGAPVGDPFAGEGRSTAFIKPKQPPKNRKTTFVPTRALCNGDDYQPNSVMLRTQPRWVKLISDRSKQQWYHSLAFPFEKLPIFLRLGLLQSVLTTAALILWLSMERDSPHQAQFVVCLFVCLCGVLFVLGHTFHYFNAILEMACHGKIQYEPGIGCTAVGALVSCGHWLSCLLAGPVLLFAAAVGFWLYCGDLTIIDWSILVELCLAAVGWWLIALLLTNLDDSVRVASPVHVVATALTMPWEFAGLTVLASAVFLGHLLVAGYAIGQLHVTPLTAFPLLWVCWSSGFYLTAFTFRRIGLTYYRAQQRLVGRKHTGAMPVVALRHQGDIQEEGSRESVTLVQQHLGRPSK